MNKSCAMIGFLILSVTAAAFAGSQSDLLKAFVDFDRAFIPPLAITNAEKVKPSRKAMAVLINNWKQFKAAYQNHKPDDPQWAKDFDYADRQIKKAADIVDSGKDLFSAHEILETVRILFMELRRRNKVDYYIDYLTEFHEYMEAIFHAGKDHTVDSLTADDIADLKNHYEEAAKLWITIGDLPFDKSLYGFSDQKYKKMKNFMARETESLDRLKKAIDSGDKPAIIKAALGIKPNYAKAYKMFGDFERVKKG
jgi:hypothetical protein